MTIVNKIMWSRSPHYVEQTEADPDSKLRSIPVSVLRLLNRTRNLYRVWWFMHYAIGLIGVVAGTLLTAITATVAPDGSARSASASLVFLREYSWFIGIIAAVATSLVTFLGPLHKAERYWSAWHLLEQACVEYRTGDTDPRLSRLMKRVMQVRRILQVIDLDEKLGAEPSLQGRDNSREAGGAARTSAA